MQFIEEANLSSEKDDDVEIESIGDDPVKNESKDEIDPLQEAEKFKNEYLYLRAEFDNYRKNAIKERSDLIKYGAERLIHELLDVVDTFDRALETPATPDNVESFRQGMELTATNLKGVLSRFGVKEENPVGQAFDPNRHEALSSEESSEIEPNHISKVFKKAYVLHDKLIRPAQVIVAKECSSRNESDNDNGADENE